MGFISLIEQISKVDFNYLIIYPLSKYFESITTIPRTHVTDVKMLKLLY